MGTSELEENENVSTTEGSNEVLTTEGSDEVSITEENSEIGTTEGSDEVSPTEGKAEIATTEGNDEVSITEVNSEIATTKGNGELLTTEGIEASPISGGMSMTILIVTACMAILFGICLIPLIYYWRKLKVTDRSGNTYAVKFEDRLSEYNENADPSAQGSVCLSLQPDRLLQNKANISVNVELIQYDSSGTDIEDTRL
jgi:hypothetical protein